jgi:hypothetical protein
MQSSRLGALAYQDISALKQLSNVQAAAGFAGGLFEPRFAEVERLNGTIVTADFFEVLGVRPALGRDLVPSDETTAVPKAVMIGDSLWRTRFGKDPSVLDRPTVLGGLSVVIVGILPPGFALPSGTNVWAAAAWRPMPYRIRYLTAVARLDPGVVHSTRVSLSAREVTFAPATGYFRPTERSSIILTMIATGVLVAVAWLHVGMILLGNTQTRSRETGVSLCLGATRQHLGRQFLLESVFLLFVVGVASTALLPVVVQSLSQILPPDVTLGQNIAVDYRSLLFLLCT